MITSRIPTAIQNFITMRLEDFAPHTRSCLYQIFTRLVFLGSDNSLPQSRCADFDAQYVERRRFAQGCAFWGPEN